MKCPFCNFHDSQVKDSRPAEDGLSIRRRRQCSECGARFTTYERIQLADLTVIKKDDRREPFDRDKLASSLTTSLSKRPVDAERIERIINSLVRQFETMGETEISSVQIGERVMDTLKELDTVGYVRFASVYRAFQEVDDFTALVETLHQEETKS